MTRGWKGKEWRQLCDRSGVGVLLKEVTRRQWGLDLNESIYITVRVVDEEVMVLPSGVVLRLVMLRISE